jgi:hypothetical protein
MKRISLGDGFAIRAGVMLSELAVGEVVRRPVLPC